MDLSRFGSHFGKSQSTIYLHIWPHMSTWRRPGGALAAPWRRIYINLAAHMPNVASLSQKIIVLPPITFKVVICTFLRCLEARMAKTLNQNHQKAFQIGPKKAFNSNIYRGLYAIV